MGFLLDVNVLVAMMHARHPHSAKTIEWLAGQDAPSALLCCRVAQMGALRILTRPAAMGEDVLNAAEFWRGWSQLMQDERFAFAAEPEGLAAAWLKLTLPFEKGRCAETDAYFAARALAGGWALVTLDQGMKRFKDVRVTVL